MSNQDQQTKKTWQPPSWLLEAAKKRSGVPVPPVNEAFLERLQYAREHSKELERKVREDAIRSGRDPDAFARTIAVMQKDVPRVQLAQRLKEVRLDTTVLEPEIPVLGAASINPADGVERTATTNTVEQCGPPTSPKAQPNAARNPVQASVPPALSVRAQSRATTSSTAARDAQIQKRNERRNKKDSTRKATKRNRTTSSASGTASPMDINDFQPAAGATASDVVHEALAVTASMPTNITTSNDLFVAASYPFPVRSTMPSWYTSISASSLAQLDRKRPQELAAIDALKNCIKRCEDEKNNIKLNNTYNELRNHVHKAEIKLNMDRIKVRKTRILTETGLPRIFSEDAQFPWDLKADAWYLYERWMNEDFEQDILRGIVTVKGKDRNGDRIDHAYRQKHPKDPKFFGDEGVVLGQWWPSQLCTVRDGAHGAAQGGIYGDKDNGAYSIVLSGGGYHDQDDGDTIEYSGTEGSNFKAKDATLSMITSARTGNDIRVIRSSQLLKANKYRPSCGLRYDGLYQVKSYKEIDKEKQTYRFHLERNPGQEPIRFEGDAKRPTMFEEEAYDKCKGRI